MAKAGKVRDYVDLHSHSTHSYLDGSNSPEEIAAKCAELGRYAHALTDHGNVSVHPAWEQAARAVGVKPLFGVEVYFTPDVEWQREHKERPQNTHLTVLAETQAGYSNMLRMVSQSYRDGFYYRAWTDEANVQQHTDGLIFLSGCLSSMMSRLLIGDRLDDAVALAEYWRGMVGKDNYFLETQLFTHADSLKVNQGIMQVHLRTDIPMVTTNDVHMIDGSEQQRDNRRLLHCIRDGRRWDDDPGDFSYSSEYPLTLQEVRDNAEAAGLVDWYEHMMDNVMAIAERCTVELPKSSFIEFPLPPGTDKIEHLSEMVKEGAAFRGIDLQEDKAYGERAEYEFRIIEEKGYIDYFLVTADMVQWAKGSGILVGPARGSAAGSLLCWLLRITEVDPLRWGLMFERFVDLSRTDLPDIDLDFDPERRGEVREYFERKYGADRVGVLGTFVQWKGRNSLDAVGKAFQVPKNVVADVKEQIDDRTMPLGHTLDVTFGMMPVAEKAVEAWPVLRRAQLLEGQMKSWSTHACGLLLSSVPLTDVCATYRLPNKEDGVCSVDYDGASHLGMLKVDILGLTVLAIIREVLDAVGMSFEEYYALEPDDELTMQGFRDDDVLGVFQFGGVTNRYLLRLYPRVESLFDLSHITALARPGPRNAGADQEFLDRRRGYRIERDEEKRERRVPVEQLPIHPDVDRILAPTYGMMVYQEQLLTVGREVGGLSWDDCNELRKAISKKRGTAEFERVEGDFLRGAVESGVEPDAAQGLWDTMVTFGDYAFNLSHSISYALLGYHTMYLKQHYPAEFYAAICRHEPDEGVLRSYLLEFQRKGGTIFPVDINRSDVRWRAERVTDGGMGLRAGLASVKNVGERTAQHIVAHRPYKDEEQLSELRAPSPTARNPDRVAKVANSRVLTALREAGAFEENDAVDYGGLGEFVRALATCGVTHKLNQVTREMDAEYFVVAGRLTTRVRRSLSESRKKFSRQYNPETGKVEEKDKQQRPPRSPELDEYVTLILEDDRAQLPCTVNRFKFPEMNDLIWKQAEEGDIFIARGSTTPGFRYMRVDELELAYKLTDKGYVALDEMGD